MLAHIKRWHLLLVLPQAMLLAARVAATPIDHDDRSLESDRRGGRAVLADAAAAAADPWMVAMDGAAAALLSTDDSDGKGLASIDALRGVAQEAPASLFVNTGPGADRSGGFGPAEQRDPLARVLRAMVNVNRQRHISYYSPQAVEAASRQAGPDLGEDVAAAILKMEASLAAVVNDALDARVDDDGRVTFSLAGVEGFHVTARDGEFFLGRGDTTLVRTDYGSAAIDRRIAALDAFHAPPAPPSRSANPVRELIDMGVAIVRYPLVWVLVALAAIGKVALIIATRRARRSRSASGAASEPTRVKRSRSRYRIKRSRSRGQLQEL
ncbi:MAG: hypothetical protein H6942_02435 [Candidatus Accumulibacter sp.]|uniref:hypothetical protein n=1 Tax=Accumulibacter sp. TaxID=2053492 RepID=UPI0019FDA7E5|nr:hypothetical protein [Accumulibacter sp.]MBE2257879.1 hypothetical protein [Paracoccaceae bacterium]MCB1940672.1 hypothetical protein [Accumulibacter sp.]MCP5247393.1 hypothetical protein [Accumulibacter sp.]